MNNINFNNNLFGNNNSNQTRIISKYNQVSKDGGRVSLNDIKKRMEQLKSKDLNAENSKMTNNSLNNMVNNESGMVNSDAKNQLMGQNRIDQAKLAKDRMNSFRNLGK